MEPWRKKCSDFRKKLEHHTGYLQKLLKYLGIDHNQLNRIKQKEKIDVANYLALGKKDKDQDNFETATMFEDACKNIQDLIQKYPIATIDAIIERNKNESDINYQTRNKNNSRVDLNLNSTETVLLPNPNYSGQPNNNAEMSINVNMDPKVKKSETQDYRIKTAENLNCNNSSKAISKLVHDRANHNHNNSGIPPGAGLGRGRGRGHGGRNISRNGVAVAAVDSSEYSKDQFASYELSRPGSVAAAATAWDDMELEDEIKMSSSASGSISSALVSADTENPNLHPDWSNSHPFSHIRDQQFERQRQEDFLATEGRFMNGNESNSITRRVNATGHHNHNNNTGAGPVTNNNNNAVGSSKTWELSDYELLRSPQKALTDGNEIAVSQRAPHSEFMCPICLDMLHQTMTTKECLHRFCRECIVTALLKGNKECPTCRKKLVSKRNLRPDPNFDMLISKIYASRDEYEAQRQKAVAGLSKSNNQLALSSSIEEGMKVQSQLRKVEKAGGPGSKGTNANNSINNAPEDVISTGEANPAAPIGAISNNIGGTHLNPNSNLTTGTGPAQNGVGTTNGQPTDQSHLLATQAHGLFQQQQGLGGQGLTGSNSGVGLARTSGSAVNSNSSHLRGQGGGPSPSKISRTGSAGGDNSSNTSGFSEEVTEVELVFKPRPDMVTPTTVNAPQNQTRFMKTTSNATVEHLTKYLGMRLALDSQPDAANTSNLHSCTIYVSSTGTNLAIIPQNLTLSQVCERYWRFNKPLELYYSWKKISETATTFEEACKNIQNLTLKYPISAIDAITERNSTSCDFEQRHSHRPMRNVNSQDMVCNPLFKSNNNGEADAVVTTSATSVKPDQCRREREQFNVHAQSVLDVTMKVPGNFAPITTISQQKQTAPAPIPQLSLVDTLMHQGFAPPVPGLVVYPNQNQTYPTSSSFAVLDIQKSQNLQNVGNAHPQQLQLPLTSIKTKTHSLNPLIAMTENTNNGESTIHGQNELNTDPQLKDLDTVPFVVPELPSCNRQLRHRKSNQTEDLELNSNRSHENSKDNLKGNKASNNRFGSRPYLAQRQTSASNGDDNNGNGATELSSSKLISQPLKVQDKLATPGLCALGKKLPRTTKIFEETPLPPLVKSKTNGTGIGYIGNCKGLTSIIAAEEIGGVVTSKNEDSERSKNGEATNQIYIPQNAIKKVPKGKIIKRQSIKMKFSVSKKPSIVATVSSSGSKSYSQRKRRVIYSSSSDSEDGGGRSSQIEAPSNKFNAKAQEHDETSQITSDDILNIILESLQSRGFSDNEIGNIMNDPAAMKELYAILKMKIKTVDSVDSDSAPKGLKSNSMNRESCAPKNKPTNTKCTAGKHMPKKPVEKDTLKPRRNSELSLKIKFMRALGLRPVKIKKVSRSAKQQVPATTRQTRSSTMALKLKLESEEKSKLVATSSAQVTTSTLPDSISSWKD